MNSGRETISFRYLVVGAGKILLCADTRDEVEKFIQQTAPKNIAVYQQRYVSEGVLCSVGYEDDFNLMNEDRKSADDPTT